MANDSRICFQFQFKIFSLSIYLLSSMNNKVHWHLEYSIMVKAWTLFTNKILAHLYTLQCFKHVFTYETFISLKHFFFHFDITQFYFGSALFFFYDLVYILAKISFNIQEYSYILYVYTDEK